MNNKVKFLRGTSNEYAVAEKDGDTIYFTTDDGKLYIGDKEVSGDGGLTIDDTLSDTSTNPVQNKVVKQAIDNKADKTVATTSADGLMSAEDKSKLDGVGDTYALKSKYGDTTIDVGRLAGSNIGQYSTAEGNKTIASGQVSKASGYYTEALGDYSYSGGFFAKSLGHSSFAYGNRARTSKNNEVAFGIFNISNDDTLFSIGDGKADNGKHNAFEITKTGGKLHDKEISTTPIKSTNVSGTTNENGDIYLWGVDTGNIPISACGSPDTVFSPFLNGDSSIYMLHAINVYTDSPVVNTSVNATVYYF